MDTVILSIGMGVFVDATGEKWLLSTEMAVLVDTNAKKIKKETYGGDFVVVGDVLESGELF